MVVHWQGTDGDSVELRGGDVAELTAVGVIVFLAAVVLAAAFALEKL
jgi:hypothetical protein